MTKLRKSKPDLEELDEAEIVVDSLSIPSYDVAEIFDFAEAPFDHVELRLNSAFEGQLDLVNLLCCYHCCSAKFLISPPVK